MTRRNIRANLIGRLWGIASVYLFAPLYLHFLGIEAFGLVGFYSTLLAVLTFADMGFTASLNREMAKLSALPDTTTRRRNVLRTYESFYCCVAPIMIVIIWAIAPVIAERWLAPQALLAEEITTAIRLMGVAIAFQVSAGLFIGGLMGLQLQVRANAIQIAWSLSRGIGTVLILWLFSPTILAFALWQVISNGAYCVVARRRLWDVLSLDGAQSYPRFQRHVISQTWRYATGMVSISIVSTLTTQADKLAVSKMLSLEMLGYYTLAGTLAAVPFLLAGPIGAAVFPRFTGMVAAGDSPGLVRLYRQTCQLVSVAVIPAGLTIAMFADELVYIWTVNLIASEQAGEAASLLAVGWMVQALTVVPFYVVLSHGNTKFNVLVGIASLALITTLLIPFVRWYGLVGAGMAWCIANLCMLVPYLYVVHSRFLPGELRTWYTQTVGRPLLVSACFVVLFHWFLPPESSWLISLSIITMGWGVAVIVSAISLPEGRLEAVSKARRVNEIWNSIQKRHLS